MKFSHLFIVVLFFSLYLVLFGENSGPSPINVVSAISIPEHERAIRAHDSMSKLDYMLAEQWRRKAELTQDFHLRNLAKIKQNEYYHAGNVEKIASRKETHDENVHKNAMKTNPPCRSFNPNGSCRILGL